MHPNAENVFNISDSPEWFISLSPLKLCFHLSHENTSIRGSTLRTYICKKARSASNITGKKRNYEIKSGNYRDFPSK